VAVVGSMAEADFTEAEAEDSFFALLERLKSMVVTTNGQGAALIEVRSTIDVVRINGDASAPPRLRHDLMVKEQIHGSLSRFSSPSEGVGR
jgi:hypothetical protein